MRLTVNSLAYEAADVTLNGVDTDFVNVVRQGLLLDVPILAMDSIDFHEYDGDIPSSTIAHRIGQLPLRFRREFASRAPPELHETAVFSIDIVADSSRPRLTWIRSTDITCVSGDAEIVHYRSPEEAGRACKDKGFMVVPLQAGQRLKATLYAKVMTSRFHPRWNSVHVVVMPAESRDDEFRLKIETTGAVSAEGAFLHVLQTAEKRLRAATEHFVAKADRVK